LDKIQLYKWSKSISMHKLFLSLFLILSTISAAFSQDNNETYRLNEYLALNDRETRLHDYKDSKEELRLKLKQLDIINQSRKKHRAKALRLDILASRVANKMCREAAENGYVGHWNLAGEKPYHRYAAAGGTDHITENASGESTTGLFIKTGKAISAMMERNHNAFMSEKRPNDGHKQAIIEKTHNYVGLGYYITDNHSAYYEYYIDRYYEFRDVPESVRVNESFILRCKPADNQYFGLVLAYYEKFPRPLSPGTISSRPYYDDYTNKVALQIPPWEVEQYRKGDWYDFKLKFSKPGMYYIQIFSDSKPYKEGKKYSSEGKLQGSGIVIKVLRKAP